MSFIFMQNPRRNPHLHSRQVLTSVSSSCEKASKFGFLDYIKIIKYCLLHFLVQVMETGSYICSIKQNGVNIIDLNWLFDESCLFTYQYYDLRNGMQTSQICCDKKHYLYSLSLILLDYWLFFLIIRPCWECHKTLE